MSFLDFIWAGTQIIFAIGVLIGIYAVCCAFVDWGDDFNKDK